MATINLKSEFPPIIQLMIPIGDTFLREISRQQIGFDHTGGIVSYQVRDKPAPDGNIVIPTKSVSIENIVVPTTETDVGSCSFVIALSNNETQLLRGKNPYYIGGKGCLAKCLNY